MSQRLWLFPVLALLAVAIFVAQSRVIDAPASARSIMYFVADSERELTRLPAAFTRISDADEIKVGDGMAKTFLSATVRDDTDVLIEAYVAQVGSKVASKAQRRLPYRFHYVPNRHFINAFALPGGHIFIGAGLLERMDKDDELAAVLSHEIEHVDHYHCAERLQTEAALRKIPLGRLLGISIDIFTAGYSKDQELEADREGVHLAARAGYSASGAIHLLENLDKLAKPDVRPDRSPQEELSRVAADVLTGYFRSHPPSADRISRVKAIIAREPGMAAHSEQDLKIAYIFLARQSMDALSHDEFEKAVELASRALSTKADHTPALQALAEARFALEDLPAAQAVYRTLLMHDAAAAGLVGNWAQKRAEQLLSQGEYDQVIVLARGLLDLQPDWPKVLTLLAAAQVGNRDLESATATAENLTRLYPTDAARFADQMEQWAANLLDSQSFDRSALVSRLCLALRRDSPNVWRRLGDAEFARADFAEASSAYQHLFRLQPPTVSLLRAFTEALGSARPATAAGELQAIVASSGLQGLPPSAVQVESAGLALLAGNDAPARAVQEDVEGRTVPPELLARLGWWYFRAHRIDEAGVVLHKALNLRPSAAEIQNNLAWVGLEAGRNDGGRFASVEDDSGVKNTPEIGNAIARWEQKNPDEALREWRAIRRTMPQWLNDEWRSAIYPPRVSQAVREIEVEYRRRHPPKAARNAPGGKT